MTASDPIAASSKQSGQSYTLLNTSHEFPVLSWFARSIATNASGGGAPAEMASEEKGHRLVWGLLSDGIERPLSLPASEPYLAFAKCDAIAKSGDEKPKKSSSSV